MRPADPPPDDDSFSERLEALDESIARSTTPGDVGSDPLHHDPDLPSGPLNILERDRRRKLQSAAPIIASIFGLVPFGNSLDRFKILKVLGRGGHGTVLLAHDPESQGPVALKIPHPEVIFNPGLRKRFLQEAEIAARLNHPNLARIHEVREAGPYCFLVMEYVHGWPLSSVIKKLKRTIQPDEAAAFVATLAEAVECMHREGVCHRDLKPSNILVFYQGRVADDERPIDFKSLIPKVIDFGLAKGAELEDHSMTRTGVVLGTTSYMAPEQARGRPSGPSADIYSLGVLLYEILAGQPPFRGASDASTLHRVIHEPAPSLRRARNDVPVPLSHICARCLEKKESARFATAAELANLLRRFAAGDSLTIPQPPRWRRAAARLSHWTTCVSPLVILAVPLLALGLVSGYLWKGSSPETTLPFEPERPGDRAARENERRNRYENNILMAQNAISSQLRPAAFKILGAEIPEAGEDDPRGFEWHYLWRQLNHMGLRPVVHHHKAFLDALAYSHDGRVLAAAGNDGVVYLWDAKSMRSLGALPGHKGEIASVVFLKDGTLVTTGKDGTSRHWDPISQRELSKLAVSPGQILLPNPKGDALARFASDRSFRISDLERGKETLFENSNHYTGFNYSRDGRFVAGRCSTAVRIWEAATGRSVAYLDYAAQDPLCTEFLPNAKAIVVGYATGKIVLWEIASEKPNGVGYAWPGGTLHSLATATDGSWLAAAGDEKFAPGPGLLRVWETKTGRLMAQRTNPSATFTVLATSPDGKNLATICADYSVYLISPLLDEFDSIQAHLGEASPPLLDASIVASLGSPGLHSLGLAVAAPIVGRTSEVFAAAFSPDGRWLATAGDDWQINLWETSTWRLHRTLTRHTSLVSCLAFTDARTLISGSYDESLRVWDPQSGKLLDRLPATNQQVGSLHVAPGGHELITGGRSVSEATIKPSIELHKLWRNGEKPVRVVVDEGIANGLAYLGEREIVGAMHTGTLVFQDLRDNTTVVKKGTRGGYTCLVKDARGNRFAVGTSQGVIELWDGNTRSLLWSAEAHPGEEIRALAFSTDGKTLASVGVEYGIKLWSTATKTFFLNLNGPHSLAKCLQFSPDNKLLISTHFDGHVYFWRAGE